MRKICSMILCVLMVGSLSACSSKPAAKVLEGKAKGFAGEITAKVTMDGDSIVKVEVVGEKETKDIGTKALEQLPALIEKAGNTDVDVIAGATVTSKAIIYAVNNAIDPTKYPFPIPEEKAEVNETVVSDLYQGFGFVATPRMGPGKDNEEVPVYSFNQVFAHVLFDGDGKIIEAQLDQLEVATPNYDGDKMPHFSGFPGQSGYNMDENHDGTVDGITENTEDLTKSEIAGWKTKRERGEDYVMGTGTWHQQMDAYQKLFVGKTVAEVEEWFAKYCSDRNGRPLKDASEKPEDKAKYDALSADEKTMLADVVSSATMSLNDAHGNLVEALQKAYDNRTPLTITSAKGMGQGIVNSLRLGPGKDNTEVQVYSTNQVVANTLFDADDKIAAIYIDQLEVATPNYDGDKMPHFSGFPGQSGYNIDENHDGTVDGVTENTEDLFISQIAGWATKRERGADYVMGTGTWTDQIKAFEKLFVGKSVAEVEEWFAKYCSDLNGRPLKDASEKPEDKAKYDALSDDEKAMLADVVSSATMSLNDAHGDIIQAIKKSLENKVAIDLTIK